MAIKTYEAFKAPSPYEQERLRAERQRRYAELLEQQAMEPEGEFTYQGIRAMPSPAAALGKLLSAYQSKKAREKAEEAEARKTGMEEQAAGQIMGRLMGGRPMTDANTIPDESGLAEVAIESQYRASPEDAMRKAMTPQGVGAVRGNPMLAAALQRSMERPEIKTMEFGNQLVNVAGGKATPVIDASGKPLSKPADDPAPTQLARLIAERDALPQNDPKRAVYDAAIRGETQGRGTTVNLSPSPRDLRKDEGGLRDELKWLVAETGVHMVCDGGGFFEGCVGGDHLTRNQIGTDAEMFQRALRLRAPEFVGGNFHVPQAVGFFAECVHWLEVGSLECA